ncbi:MAG: sporulation integral membrane protein YlbJ, partial [Defluviitaleaceae bacterium]|nr:sporulation integral membrane protein YlbJ [Defluviitaleaceae bacterium]
MIGASAGGLKLWLDVVFPSLFPFMAGVNVLMELGAVETLGRAMGPVMRVLFRMPGAGGFPLVCGMVSGYPIGAKLTARLRERGELSRRQAQRLLGFANNCGPLFIVGAVGAGMFKNAGIGYFILGTHCFSAVLTG